MTAMRRRFKAGEDARRFDVLAQLLPAGRVVDMAAHHPERATDAQQGGGHLGHAAHAGIDHNQVEIGVFGQKADLLRVPHHHRSAGIEEATQRDGALGIGHLHGDDHIHTGGVEHLRRGFRLVLFFHQGRADRLTVVRQDAADAVGGLLRHRAHVSGFVIVIFQ